WKQLLPVATGLSAEIASDITLLNSPLWKDFKVLTLTKNIRAESDEEFAEFLEDTGEGKYKGDHLPYVLIDEPGVMMPSQPSLIQSIYEGKLDDEEYLFRTCVLCTTNKHAEYVNSVVLKHVRGEERVYRAYDESREGIAQQMPPEFFCTNMESGMPPFWLRLRVGAIVILLRNLDLRSGLCNGTRLIVDAMYEKSVTVRQLDPRWKGQTHDIGRMEMTPPETKQQKALYTRTQLPFRL
ncbi:hypothetical protein PENTCL1PPCAC_3950, partial [Pristionchus entomophagus]